MRQDLQNRYLDRRLKCPNKIGSKTSSWLVSFTAKEEALMEKTNLEEIKKRWLHW